MKKLLLMLAFLPLLSLGQNIGDFRDLNIRRYFIYVGDTVNPWHFYDGDTLFFGTDTIPLSALNLWQLDVDTLKPLTLTNKVQLDSSLMLPNLRDEPRVGFVLGINATGDGNVYPIQWNYLKDTLVEIGVGLPDSAQFGQTVFYDTTGVDQWDTIPRAKFIYTGTMFGLSNEAPESLLDVGGSLAKKAYATLITSSLDLASGSNGNNYYYYTDPGGTALNITLPAYASTTYREYIVVNTDAANNTTLKVQSGEVLNGSVDGTFTITPLDAVIVHNSGIAALGWVVVIFGTR